MACEAVTDLDVVLDRDVEQGQGAEDLEEVLSQPGHTSQPRRGGRGPSEREWGYDTLVRHGGCSSSTSSCSAHLEAYDGLRVPRGLVPPLALVATVLQQRGEQSPRAVLRSQHNHHHNTQGQRYVKP